MFHLGGNNYTLGGSLVRLNMRWTLLPQYGIRMLNLTDKEIATIELRLTRSINGLASAKEKLELQRSAFVALTVDTADQIALVEALCQSLPDPTLFEGKIALLKKRLEEFEDLFFNPQDKPEILEAIASRPNTANATRPNDTQAESSATP